jgi:high affinity Mn2+ porin
MLTASPWCRGADTDATVTLSENWSGHGQATVVWQGHGRFNAAFSGANSLTSEGQGKETFDSTLFLGARLADGLAFYVDPEIDQGFGLSNTLGAGGFTSGEAYKIGHDSAYFRLPRAFFRYVADLGGESVVDGPAANQLAGSHRQDNVTITVGKFGVPDIFDTNPYAHDPKGDFLNWSIIESGAFDYAADSWGYTYGAAAEWTQSWWSLRAGLFDLSRTPNSPELEIGFGQFSVVVEGEERHELRGQPGAVKLLLFANRGYMGSYDAAVALAQSRAAPADTALVRRYATRPGGAINVQQQIAPDLGAFLRASLNDGSKETFDFTDINESLSLGLSWQGTRWKRPDDTVGLAGVINGISSAARSYFASGGLSVLIGDGALPVYRPEQILETYYKLALAEWAGLSFDYQYLDHPAYNPVRGPVSVIAVRFHAEF